MLGRRPHSNPRNWTSSIAWSPDGRLLAIGSADASAGIWDAATGEQLLALDGHSDIVLSIEFSPDGRRVMTSSNDGTVRIWDIAKAYQ